MNNVVRQLLCISLIFSITFQSFAEGGSYIRKKLAAVKAGQTFKNINQDPGSLRRYGRSALTRANTKIDQSAVGKAGKAWVNKAGVTYATTLAMLISKEVFSRLQEENLEVNATNITKKVEEIETEWDKKEKSVFVALDAAILYPLTVGLESGAAKTFPKLAERKFAGQLLNSFIVGLMLSVGLSFINETIHLANRFLIENPHLFGNLSVEEIKSLTLLKQRFGISYFTYGLINGGPITKSAYRKVLSSLSYLLFQEDELRNILWSHVIRESALNGGTITTFSFALLAGTIRGKIIPDGVKFGSFKKTTYSIVAALSATILLPQWFQDKLTYWSREAWKYTFTHKITEHEGSFINAKMKRQYLANNFFPVIKMANDQIEVIMAEQKKIIKKYENINNASGDKLSISRMLLFQSPSLEKRLIEKLEDNASNIIMYQGVIKNSLDTIIKVYEQDLADLLILNKKGLHPAATAEQIKSIDMIISYLETVKETLTTQYVAADPKKINYNTSYDDLRQNIDRFAFWGFYEEDIVKNILTD